MISRDRARLSGAAIAQREGSIRISKKWDRFADVIGPVGKTVAAMRFGKMTLVSMNGISTHEETEEVENKIKMLSEILEIAKDTVLIPKPRTVPKTEKSPPTKLSDVVQNSLGIFDNIAKAS